VQAPENAQENGCPLRFRGGSVQIAIFVFLILVLLLAAWPNLIVAPARAIKPVLALLSLLIFCVGLYWLYVKPWLLRRRKEKELAGDAE
jgi:hypothetical protein